MNVDKMKDTIYMILKYVSCSNKRGSADWVEQGKISSTHFVIWEETEVQNIFKAALYRLHKEANRAGIFNLFLERRATGTLLM